MDAPRHVDQKHCRKEKELAGLPCVHWEHDWVSACRELTGLPSRVLFKRKGWTPNKKRSLGNGWTTQSRSFETSKSVNKVRGGKIVRHLIIQKDGVFLPPLQISEILFILSTCYRRAKELAAIRNLYHKGLRMFAQKWVPLCSSGITPREISTGLQLYHKPRKSNLCQLGNYIFESIFTKFIPWHRGIQLGSICVLSGKLSLFVNSWLIFNGGILIFLPE